MKVLVSIEKYNERLEVCKGCKHFTNMGTCGPVGVGKTIKYKRGEKELCGCFMKIKARFKFAKCPIHKWKQDDVSPEELKFLDELIDFVKGLDGREVLTSVEVKRLYEIHNYTHGSKKKTSNCAKCVKNTLEELREWIKNIE